MNLVTSFAVIIQEFALIMSAPSFENLTTVITGWVFAPKRTITQMLMAAGVAGERHHSAFHRLFSSARWSLDMAGLAVFRVLEPFVGETVFLALDDTLARKRGLKIFGVGMHHDPLLSSRGKAITNWGHSWVVLGVLLRFPLWPERVFCLPVLFRLYLNKQRAAKHRRVYRTRPELAVQMLHVLCGNRRKHRRFHVVADSAYGGQSVLCALPPNCDLTSRLLMNARLYDAPESAQKTGRPRKRGARLATPQEMLASRARRLSLQIYGRYDEVRLTDAEARVYAAPQTPLRVVAVEPLRGGRGQQAFYSTCVSAAPEQVLTWYAMRWSLEVAFHDSKQHLGFEEPQGWSRMAVERTAPMAMLLYSLIVAWFVTEGHARYEPLVRPWYQSKKQPSFADMLATLRRQSLRESLFFKAAPTAETRKLMHTLENWAALAA